MKDAQFLLGSKLNKEEADRDAVHIAVLPCVAAGRLSAGMPVKVNRVTGMAEYDIVQAVGIVDPFLSEPIFPGDKFFVWLTPNTITGLQHRWTHPVIDDMLEEDVSPITASRHGAIAKINECANACGVTFDFLIDAAKEYNENNETTHMGSNSQYSDYDDWKGFWRAFTTYTGETVKDDTYWAPFRCTC